MLPDWNTLPSLSSLRAFDATARHGGFSGAARSLNVTPAAVAQQVRALEAELGVKLAVRKGRTVSLTELGKQLSLGLSEGFGKISSSVKDLQNREERRSLRVATTTFIADTVIIPKLAKFWEKHPDIGISMLPSAGYVDVVQDGFDLAIRAGSGNWPGLESILLTQSRTIVVGAPSLIGDGSTEVENLPWLSTEDSTWETNILRTTPLDPEKI